MSYLSKFLILLALAGYAGFMDYLDKPERYKILSASAQKVQEEEELTQEEQELIDEVLKELEEEEKDMSAIYKAMENSKIGDKRLSLSYDLIRGSNLENIEHVDVKAKIINHSNQNIYFYRSSCSGLKHLFKFNPELNGGYLCVCSHSFPVKDTIKSNSTFESEFSIIVNENIQNLQLEFNLVELLADADFSFNILDEHIKKSVIIKGKPRKIQKLKGRNPRLEQSENL